MRKVCGVQLSGHSHEDLFSFVFDMHEVYTAYVSYDAAVTVRPSLLQASNNNDHAVCADLLPVSALPTWVSKGTGAVDVRVSDACVE